MTILHFTREIRDMKEGGFVTFDLSPIIAFTYCFIAPNFIAQIYIGYCAECPFVHFNRTIYKDMPFTLFAWEIFYNIT